MLTDQPVEYLLKRLKQSKLLNDMHFSEVSNYLSRKDYPNGAEAAKYLINRSIISRLQAELLLSKDHQRYFIDNYKLIEIVGSGGMGRVYVGKEKGSRWKVALKVLSEHHRRDMGIVARFQIEAQIGLKLKHPNILRTRELASTEDHLGKMHYVVMDFVRGITLGEWLEQNGPMPPDQACDIAMQTALGLEYMHQQRILHRDIKPSNLLISEAGQVKILDFGLAHVDDDDEEFSMAMIFGHECMGTPDYISPEQSIDSYDVDERADIYSLGCSLYQAIAGQTPFPYETTGEKLRGHRQQRPKRLREIRPDVDPQIDAIVHKMLAKKPTNRMSSAGEVAKYLQQHAKRTPVSFDFSEILKERVKTDRKRSTYLKRQSAITAAEQEEPEGLI